MVAGAIRRVVSGVSIIGSHCMPEGTPSVPDAVKGVRMKGKEQGSSLRVCHRGYYWCRLWGSLCSYDNLLL